MDENAYDQGLPIAVLGANNQNVPLDGDAQNQRLPISIFNRIDNHNVPEDRLDISIVNGLNLKRAISQLESEYTNHTKYIIKLLYLYVAIQAAVLTTAFYVPQKTEGCEIWRWCPLILSSLASIVMTALYIQYVVHQLGLLKNGRQLQEEHDLLVEMFARNWRIRLFYGSRTVFQEATNCWWIAPRIAFLLMLIAFTVFLTLSCTHLLC